MNTRQSKDLSIERIFSSPSLAGTVMHSLKFSPSAQCVTFLQGKTENKNQFDLWEYSITHNSKRLLVDSRVLLPEGERLSAEEKARRERQRTASFSGIVEYSWAQDGAKILFPLGGNLFVYELATKKLTQITKSKDFDTDARFSPQGKYVSFIRKQNIYVVNLAKNTVKQLTFDTKKTLKNGMAEFVAQEEMERNTGYWWSSDDKHIAYTQVDESPVGITKRYEINADSIAIIKQRYPYTGQANVKIKLGIMHLKKKKTTWLDLGKNTDIYLTRVQWLPSGKKLSYQIMQRKQQKMDLFFANLKGKRHKILTEKSKTWLNLHDDLYFLTDKSFIWASERDGYKHLYHYNKDGQLIKQLTKGQWQVDAVAGIDEENAMLYFTASKKSPTEKHLYKLDLTSLAITAITHSSGWHEVTLDNKAHYFIDNYSNRDTPQSTTLYAINGKEITTLNNNHITAKHPYFPYLSSHQKTTFGTLQAQDGQILHYRIMQPKDFDTNKKYPVYVYTYGGPHAQVVLNTWGLGIDQYMAQRGFVVFALDNRGSARRGVKFESAIYQQMGTAEIADQLVGVNYLKSLPFVDATRIGIFGWSYGGFMALKAMSKTQVFAIGVAVAPVTDFALYDTFYTERYMSSPQLNAKGYKDTAVFDDVHNIKGKLLVIHGMADDNVLFTNSTKLFKALQEAGILYDSVIYPGAKHGISGSKEHIHVWKTIAHYFIQHLSKPSKD